MDVETFHPMKMSQLTSPNHALQSSAIALWLSWLLVGRVAKLESLGFRRHVTRT